jgi:hypothetical protein
VSYTIYARPRPICTALVLDTTVFREGVWLCDALLDGIVASTIETWGGRQNPIVLIEPDKDLSADEWRELEAADPDRVQSFAPLNEAWVQRFHARLMPWKITVEDIAKEDEPKEESLEARWRWLHVPLPGLATPPIPQNLKKLPRAKLLMAEFALECPLEFGASSTEISARFISGSTTKAPRCGESHGWRTFFPALRSKPSEFLTWHRLVPLLIHLPAASFRRNLDSLCVSWPRHRFRRFTLVAGFHEIHTDTPTECLSGIHCTISPHTGMSYEYAVAGLFHIVMHSGCL